MIAQSVGHVNLTQAELKKGAQETAAATPAMVAGMRQVLLSANVDEDDIRTEDFAGY
jgi:hypothetical protein